MKDIMAKLFKDFNTNTKNNDEWLTPPDIIRSLGEFDLDPCSPIDRPWNTAKMNFNETRPYKHGKKF